MSMLKVLQRITIKYKPLLRVIQIDWNYIQMAKLSIIELKPIFLFSNFFHFLKSRAIMHSTIKKIGLFLLCQIKYGLFLFFQIK
jgi:hypothetical protein